MFAHKVYHTLSIKSVRNHYLFITLIAVLGFHVESQAQNGTRQVPRLVVNITIDQLRSDYLENFAVHYGSNGFKKLMSQGLVYENASYPFVDPDKASAISTLITGTTPSYHGITGERWFDRGSLRPFSCTEDSHLLGEPSPVNLSVSTLGDELKVTTQGVAKIFAISPFSDTAVLSAGHAADGAIWFSEKSGRWMTSQYYLNPMIGLVLNFNEIQNTSKRLKKTVWAPSYSQGDSQFKHQFKSNKRHLEYQTSALINADITHLALECISNQSIGTDEVTDMISLTYYAGHFDHKPLTECRQELEDTYIRLDQELGNLMTRLDSIVGEKNILYVLTSTGYSDPDGIDYNTYKIPTGTFYINRAANLLNMYLGALWGQGRYVEGSFDNQLFFNHKLLESKHIGLTDAAQRSQEFVSQMAGVRNVYTVLQLLNGNNDNVKKIRNSYHPQRNGDILIEVAPGWHLQNEDTGYDKLSQASATMFPIVFYGADIPSARVQTPVTTDRIAPTVAKSIRIRAPNACTAEPLF